MNLHEVISKLQSIDSRGFVPSLREGSTGIGYTFEQLFGITENNIPIPDIGGRVEIKTIRRDSQSLITLFTFNYSVWNIKQKDLVLQYGYIDDKDRHALKNTIFYGRAVAQSLLLEIDDEKNMIYLIDSNTKKRLAEWDIYRIVGKFSSKLDKLLLVIADSKKEQGKEYFHYNEAFLLTNPNIRKFLDAFKNSMIGIDIRMHLKENGTVRNRGTAFRIREKDLKELYEKCRPLKGQ